MAAFKIKIFDVVIADLPVQLITKIGEDKRQFSVIGGEMYGDHRCVVIAVDEHARWFVVVPLTSALDSLGAEKWAVWQPTWVRIVHKGKYVAALCEQIRYLDIGRIRKQEGFLSDYDQKLVSKKLKTLFNSVLEKPC